MDKQELTRRVVERAKKYDADIVAIGGAERFQGTVAVEIFPELKSVICVAYRVLRGSRRGIEEGTTYYQYSTVGIETIEETMMPNTLIQVCCALEDEGYLAIPQRRHQTVMAETDSTNPEVAYEEIYRGRKWEKQMNFEQAAVLCGLGELGLSGAVLTDEYGPFQRYAFVLTDAELEETPLYQKHLCDGCKECINACPGRALADNGEKNPWQCAVYYKGAARTKNPFMPEDAFPDIENRLDVMSGKARFHSMADAEQVLDETFFYPPIKHAYVSSICGKACDTACYVHLEEQGKLTKTFRRNFRIRPEWKLDV